MRQERQTGKYIERTHRESAKNFQKKVLGSVKEKIFKQTLVAYVLKEFISSVSKY